MGMPAVDWTADREGIRMNRDFDVEQKLTEWDQTLLHEMAIGGLIKRNPTAHKWKALSRSPRLRECAFWRLQDLMAQSFTLHQQNHGIGARILLRAGFETLAVLIHLNQITAKVLNGTTDFNTFNDDTTAMLLGSKNGTTPVTSKNIITILTHCDKRYPGITDIYADLCETAHPNFEGICFGYTKTDRQEMVITFNNRWMELHGEKHLDLMRLCMGAFEYEYDEVWPATFERLEKWVEANDAKLEASKPS